MSADIGDDSPHGKANLKVVKNLVDWMDRNREAIRGLQANSPLLPQLDLLTDEQMKAAFREMDPLAPENR